MPIIRITSLTHPGVEVFSKLTEAQLQNKLNQRQGVFIVESPMVIRVALDAGYEPISFLTEEKHIKGDVAPLLDRSPDVPVYTGARELLASLTGYTLTRGVLCAMRRPQPASAQKICGNARRVVVLEGVVDSTNVGAIFRSAAALGVGAILLTRTSCDPYNRRVVRVSMGSVFLVPWAWLDGGMQILKDMGFCTVAMALTDNSVPLDHPALKEEDRLALVMGTEGDGLCNTTIAEADYVVRIPMSHQVDSLNVAAATAVAVWELRERK